MTAAAGRSGRFVPDTPYCAGMLRLSVERKVPNPNLPLTVWYPTREPERRRRDGIFDLSFARDAEPAGEGLGLVALSHGSGGSDINHHDWAETLARHGYVVAAPRHLGDSHDVKAGLGSREQLLERPRQLRDALEAALSHPRLADRIDRRRIGALGFSAGGYTVLTLLGARPDYSRWRQYCQAHPDTSVICPLGGRSDIADPGDADWEAVADPRIGAAALLAPFALLFDGPSLARVAKPIRVYRAEHESVSLNDWNADAVAAHASGPVEAVAEEGDHYVFLAPVAEAIRDKYPEFYRDAPGIDRPGLHRRIGGELVDFFNRRLGIG